MLEIKNTAISHSVNISKSPLFLWSNALKKISFWLFLISIAFYFTNVFAEILSPRFLKISLGASFLVLGIWFLFLELNLFFERKLKKPPLKYSLSEALRESKKFNLAGFLTFKGAKIFKKAESVRKKENFKQIPLEAILLALLEKNSKIATFFVFRSGFNLGGFKEYLKNKIKTGDVNYSPSVFRVLEEAGRLAQSKEKNRIGVNEILATLSKYNPLAKFLNMENLKPKDVEIIVDWFEWVEREVEEIKKFWRKENLAKRGGIGRDFAAGFTITLDKYSADLRKMIKRGGLKKIIGHQDEKESVERTLQKQENNNALIVGEAGVGRISIVQSIAQDAFLGKAPTQINHKRIIKLDIAAISASTSSDEEFEECLDRCLAEATRAGNVIVVIEDLENHAGREKGPGKVDITRILLKYLSVPSFNIIGITTYKGLHTILENKPGFLKYFEKVEIPEISEKETLIFMERMIPFMERKHNKIISYKALREIVRLSSRYAPEIPFPEKAFRLLDESMSHLSSFSKEKVLLPAHIRKLVAEKAELPLEAMGEGEKRKLLNLENLIHKRVINQNQAVDEVSASLRRARAEIEARRGPIGGFLFLGPTGVGKTETARALSQNYFGGEKKMIRLDMSEFQSVSDIKRLLGGNRGEEGILTTPVRENPFSLILLDELEKAHPKIMNLFLQVLDEGWLTDGLGRKVDFKNTIIIATSNAVAEIIREDIRQDKKLGMVKEDLIDFLLKEKIFRPEFINRFDGIVVFKPLTKDNLIKIAELMLRSICEGLKDKGIEVRIEQGVKEKIASLGYSPEFGAREMNRVIQKRIGNLLANLIINNQIKRGDEILLKVVSDEFKVEKNYD